MEHPGFQPQTIILDQESRSQKTLSLEPSHPLSVAARLLTDSAWLRAYSPTRRGCALTHRLGAAVRLLTDSAWLRAYSPTRRGCALTHHRLGALLAYPLPTRRVCAITHRATQQGYARIEDDSA